MNRWALFLLTALLLPVASPQAQAQDGAQAVPLLDDPSNDAVLVVGGQDSSPNDRWTASDLTSLAASESLQAVTFSLGVRSLQTDPELMFVEDTSYEIVFLVRDVLYRVVVLRSADQGDFVDGQLWQYDPGRGEYFPLTYDLQGTQEVSQNILTIAVPRELLLDGDGAPPGPQTSISGFHASSVGAFLGDGPEFCVPDCIPMGGYKVTDRMPDSGNGTVSLRLQLGIAQTGHARLYSEVPIRTSNGEATTYVYQVEGHNFGAKKERFALASASVPNGWEVRLPATSIEIPSNKSVLFPVLITIPFSHSHGILQVVTLEMRSSDGTSVGRAQLGVRYAQPPQPAGHHDTLQFWSRKQDLGQANEALSTALGQSNTLFYMNAADDDAIDDATPVRADTCFTGDGDAYCWRIPLSPGLDLGLDFDLNKKGEVTLPVKTTLPISGATLSGELLYYAAAPPSDFGYPPGFFREEAIVLATVQATSPVELGAASSTGQIVTGVVVPEAASDYIPYQAGASMELELRLSGLSAQPLPVTGLGYAVPEAMQGGTMRLPLIEYHDKVESLFAAVSTLELEANSELERTVNPGKTALFNLTLRNHGEAGSFQLDLTGTHLPWAFFVTPKLETVELPSNGSIEVKVAIRVPAEAEGDELGQKLADIVVSATSTSDLNMRALARLVARVDTVNQHPDDAALVAGLQDSLEPKRTPGLDLLAVVAAVGVALLARRRRA